MRHTVLLATTILISAALAPVIAYSQTAGMQMQSSPATQAPANWPASSAAASNNTNMAPATMASTTPSAQNVGVDSVGSGAIPSLPLEPVTANGVTYINGGIGDEETAELKSKAGEFNVHILLSAPKGEFVSDVKLRLLDKKGTELASVTDAGPYFYAHVAPGAYVLETSSNGTSKSFKLNVPAKGTAKQQIVISEDGMTSPHTPTTKLD